MTNTHLDNITIEPKSEATSCVIWLHGLGDSGDGFAPVVPLLNLPDNHSVRFIFPHAPIQAVTINNGMKMRSWYDIKSMDLNNRAYLPDVEASEKMIVQLIEQQLSSGIDAKNIILAGFSQGGVMSLYTGLRYSQTLAGILALSCYLPAPNALPEKCHLANSSTPILQHHGVQDEVVPISAGKSAYDLLKKEGYNTHWKTYPMPHSVLAEQLADIGIWLKKRLSIN